MSLEYFKRNEFDCRHTGKNHMNDEFLLKLDELRRRCGFPFSINSGYRDISHPEEAKKAKGGTHSQGIAADIKVHGGSQRYKIVSEAIKMGFNGIGVAKTFVHVDGRLGMPVLWQY